MIVYFCVPSLPMLPYSSKSHRTGGRARRNDDQILDATVVAKRCDHEAVMYLLMMMSSRINAHWDELSRRVIGGIERRFMNVGQLFQHERTLLTRWAYV